MVAGPGAGQQEDHQCSEGNDLEETNKDPSSCRLLHVVGRLVLLVCLWLLRISCGCHDIDPGE